MLQSVTLSPTSPVRLSVYCVPAPVSPPTLGITKGGSLRSVRALQKLGQYPQAEPIDVWLPVKKVNCVIGGALVLNVAVTDAAALIVTAQVPVPEHPEPDQPANVDPPDATAVSVTPVPPL